MKRLAKRLMIAFFVFLALCVFFAQSVRTALTAQVDFIRPTERVLSSSVALEGALDYAEVRDVYLPAAERHPIVVEEVLVREGDWVEAGQLIAEASCEESARGALAELEKAHEALVKERILLKKSALAQSANAQSESAAALIEYLSAQRELLARRAALWEAAARAQVSLPEGESAWEEAVRRSGDADLCRAHQAWESQRAAVDALEAELNAPVKRVRLKDFEYAARLLEIERETRALTASMERLMREKGALERVRAPYAGYIVELNAPVGGGYRPEAPLYRISAGKELVVRARVEPEQRALMAGDMRLSVELLGKKNPVEGGRLTRSSEAGEARWTIEAPLPAEALPGGEEFKNCAGMRCRLLYQGESALYSMVVPAKCVVSEGEKKYLYAIERQEGYWGEEFLVKKVEVSVLDFNAQYAAIGGGIYPDSLLAANWNRALAERERVVETIR